jgi:hypothetical protein
MFLPALSWGDHSAFEAGNVIRFKIINECRGLRVEPNLGAFADEPFPLFWIIVGPIGFDSFRPGLDFLGCFHRAVTAEPGNDLFIGGTRIEQLLDFIGLNPLELKQRLVERAGEMIFAYIALEIRTAFIDHAGHQRVAAEAEAGTAWRLFSEVLGYVRSAHGYGATNRH